LVALVLAIPASLAHAAEDYVPWTEATFATELPAPYGRVQLTIKVEPSGRLLDVGVQRDGGVALRIPAVAYTDIGLVQIGQARAAYKRGFDGSPWMFVHIPFGEPIYVRNQPEWTILVIAFRGDRAVYRALNIPKPRGGFDWLPTDLPRE
jgi:hypothetical protein